MRQIGTLEDPRQAQRLADYLLTLGIKTKLDPDLAGVAIWIRDEDQLDRARTEFEQFRISPDDPRYGDAEPEARRLRAEADAYAKRFQKNQIDVRTRWGGGVNARRQPLTMVLLGLSVAMSIFSNFGQATQITRHALISWYYFQPGAPWTHLLPEIQHGQVWRLVTPIFLHFGFMHLIFNMMMLLQMGNAVEARRGPWRYGGLVLLVAIGSNLFQYAFAGPVFGGMSGVVYGLFGYIWMKSRYDPAAGLYLHQNTVFWMIGWFLLCLTGFVGAVANYAHGAGLAIGILIGILPALRRR